MANGVVYFGSGDPRFGDGIVYAVKAATGKAAVWSVTVDPNGSAWPVAVADGVVYADSQALSATTSAQLWATGFGTPVVADGVAYYTAGSLRAVNAATGAELEDFTTEGAEFFSPVVANGVVYVSSAHGDVYALHLPGGLTTPARPSPTNLHTNHRLQITK